MDGIFRKQTRRPVRPLHQAELPAVQDILHPRAERLLLVLQPVQIEMIDPAPGIAVFVNDGKGRTAHRVGNPPDRTEGMDKGRFAGPHAPVKGKDALQGKGVPERAGSLFDIGQLKYQLHSRSAKIQ